MNPLVSHIERCPLNAKVKAFFDWWNVNGPFPVVIVTGDRTDLEQLEDFKKGRMRLADGSWVILDKSKVVTNALRASESAHGHHAGADAHPVRFFLANGGVGEIYLGNEPDPVMRAEALKRLEQYADLAEQHGLESGRHYPGLADLPHVCDPNWRELPIDSVSPVK